MARATRDVTDPGGLHRAPEAGGVRVEGVATPRPLQLLGRDARSRAGAVSGAVVIGASALLAAGCGLVASSGSPSAPATASSGAGAGTSGATGSPSTPAPTSAPSTPTSVGRCRTAGLSVHIGQSTGAAGHIQQLVTFENTSTSATCTLGGYPGLQMLDASGAKIATHVTRGVDVTVPSVPLTTVTLAPSGMASFVMGYANQTGYGTATCPTSATVAITPPNAFASITVNWQISPYGGATIAELQCGEVTVSPVYAGSGLPPQ